MVIYAGKRRMTAHAIIIHEDFPLTCQTCPARYDGVCAKSGDDELLRISRIKRYQKWGAGETIAIEGGSLPFVGSIVNGSASLSRSLPDGRVQMVGMLLPADFIGKPGHKTASYEITAISNVTFCTFDTVAFKKFLDSSSDVPSRLLDMALNDLDNARSWMLLLGRKTAREKVAHFLSLLFQRARPRISPLRCTLPLTRDTIATYLGLSLETVSRQVTALRRDGLIRLENNGRTMLCDDLSALRLAAGETTLD